jgi:hypothetical protein
LDDVKYIKNVFGVTVNDVLVSALTAAFRSYLLDTDQLVEEDLLTAIPGTMKHELIVTVTAIATAIVISLFILRLVVRVVVAWQ